MFTKSRYNEINQTTKVRTLLWQDPVEDQEAADLAAAVAVAASAAVTEADLAAAASAEDREDLTDLTDLTDPITADLSSAAGITVLIMAAVVLAARSV